MGVPGCIWFSLTGFIHGAWLQFIGCICSWHEFTDVLIPWRYGWLDVLACVVDVISNHVGFFFKTTAWQSLCHHLDLMLVQWVDASSPWHVPFLP